jgi:N-succinyldiaminopimelate aminotransferase
MNPRLERLHAYPFERLARLTAPARPSAAIRPIAMSIGEPRHEPPAMVLQALRDNAHQLGTYPTTAGVPELRGACAAWLERRFGLTAGSVDPATMVLPVNGTREALFAFVQAALDSSRDARVAMPNPFYQIYEGAVLLAGGEPYFLDTTGANAYTPDLAAVPESLWRHCQVLFLCSPGNPTGKVFSRKYLQQALELAERYDFIVAADECYSEIYLDEARPPPGLLEAAQTSGRDRFERCIVFHSLSKRSSVPGLRSGFVAGDPAIIAKLLLYRTYHGCAMPVPTQLASIVAWQDDAHVVANRRLYREKFERVLPILAPVLPAVAKPEGAFYLWSEVGGDGDDERFTRELYATQGVLVLPGSYLARDGGHGNPGAGRVRISLVPGVAECVEAAERIRAYLESRKA